MIIGVFIEPEECFQRRKFEDQQRVEQEARRRLAKMDDLLTELVIETLGGSPGSPSVSMTNSVSKSSILASRRRASCSTRC